MRKNAIILTLGMLRSYAWSGSADTALVFLGTNDESITFIFLHWASAGVFLFTPRFERVQNLRQYRLGCC